MNKFKLLLRYRRILIILTHFVIFIGAYFLAFSLRFEFDVPLGYEALMYKALPLLVGFQLICFSVYNQYFGLWQYVSTNDLAQLIKANVLAAVGFVCSLHLLGWTSFPRSVIISDFLATLALTCALRFSFKFLKEVLDRNRYSLRDHNILIVGAGHAGVMMFKEIMRNPQMGDVIGFIDDDPKKHWERIQNIKILGKREDIPDVVNDYDVDEIIIAMPSADGPAIRDILNYCEQSKAKIRVVPGLDKIISGEMELKPREVMPDDLLGRETVKINSDQVMHYVKDRVVLVTGAGGSIGSEICRQLAFYHPQEILLFDHYEHDVYFLSLELKNKYPGLRVTTIIGDIRDVGLIKNSFSKFRPHVVFHAAAHKHVPLMEENPVAAVKNNIFGTRNVIYASSHYGVERFVLISTDKAVNPINIMGMSKRVAEMILQCRAARSRTKYMAVRFGNVLGSAGSVVPLFKRQIDSGGPITVTHPDVRRYFMSIKEAVMLVLQAGAIGKGGELFILDMGEQIKIVEIAKNLVALSGLTLDKDIQIKFTGLRLGEKLEEELLLDKEKDVVTQHNKIFVSSLGVMFDRLILNRDLRQLHLFCQQMNEKEIFSLLKEIIAAGNGSKEVLSKGFEVSDKIKSTALIPSEGESVKISQAAKDLSASNRRYVRLRKKIRLN